MRIRLDGSPEKDIYIPHKVEKWYNRSSKSWVVQVLDRYGNQIGDASYVHSRKEADDEVEYLERTNGLKK